MKVALTLFLSTIVGASAFVPPSIHSTTRALFMTEEEEEELTTEETAEVPAVAEGSGAASLTISGKPKVPLFGGSPLPGGGSVFVGENYWDKLTTEYGSAETGKFLRAAELKHCRSAMLATVGFAFHKLGWTLNNISPHEYLSVTQDIKFEDLAAMTPLEAMKSLPPESTTQMFCAIAIVELYELTHVDGKFQSGESIAPGWKAGGLTGDLGWNPLGVEITDRRRLSELSNGRAAMVAIFAWVCADMYPGSVPVMLPW